MDESTESPSTSTVLERPADRSRRPWKLSGWGFPRTLEDLRFRDVAVPIVVALTIWGYVDVRQRGRIVAGHADYHMTDFTVFTAAGEAFFSDRDPYRVTNPRGWYYLYPPLLALLVAPLAVLDSQAQVGVWFVVSVALAFGCYGESLRIWRFLVRNGDQSPREHKMPAADRPVIPTLWVAVCAVLSVFLPTLDCLQRGQVGVALLYPLLLGFRLALQSRGWASRFLGGVVLALPAAIKLIPALPVVFLLIQWWSGALASGGRINAARRAAVLSCGVLTGGLLFLLVIPAACLGWNKNLDHLRTWSARVAVNDDVGKTAAFYLASTRNQSLVNATRMLAAKARGDWFDVPVRAADLRAAYGTAYLAADVMRGIVVVELVCLAVLTGMHRRSIVQGASFGLACQAVLLLSPLSWGHYYQIELPALLFVPLWMARRGHMLAAKILAVVPALLSWGFYVAMPWSGPVGLLGLGTTLWFLAAASLILGDEFNAALHRRPVLLSQPVLVSRTHERHTSISRRALPERLLSRFFRRA
jgi:hypothetical protein